MVDVELVEVVGKGEVPLPVSDVANGDIMPQNAMQQPKKYNNIGQPRQQNMSQGNSSCIQESYKMTPTATSQPVGFLANYMLYMTRPILRLDTEVVSQWNGYYWTTNPPSMSSSTVGSSRISGALINTCISIVQPE